MNQYFTNSKLWYCTFIDCKIFWGKFSYKPFVNISSKHSFCSILFVCKLSFRKIIVCYSYDLVLWVCMELLYHLIPMRCWMDTNFILRAAVRVSKYVSCRNTNGESNIYLILHLSYLNCLQFKDLFPSTYLHNLIIRL